MRRPFAIVAASLTLACSNGVGELCAENRPCQPSLECVFVVADAGLGACDYPLGKFGERCETADDCAAGLTCSSHFTPGERHGTCIHQRAVGEPCVLARDCASGHCRAALSGPSPGYCEP